MLSKLQVSPKVDATNLARRTPGYVASDLLALCREGGVNAVRRISSTPDSELLIEMQDLEAALKTV
jgi:SpoVK/Ycf46/Vps4 family AAA+-type ATPase